MLRFAKVVRTRLGERVRTLLVNLRGLGDEGDDDAAETLDEVETLQPLGLFSRPTITAKLEALVAELGEEVVALLLGDKGAGVLGDVEEGETRVYSAGGSTCRVRLRADGSIDIEATSNKNIRITSAGSGDVVLNGGSLKVARVTDPTTGHTHTVTHALTAPPMGGAVTGTITISTATDTIASSGGAARVKA
jgi:phage gp45-like